MLLTAKQKKSFEQVKCHVVDMFNCAHVVSVMHGKGFSPRKDKELKFQSNGTKQIRENC